MFIVKILDDFSETNGNPDLAFDQRQKYSLRFFVDRAKLVCQVI